jgi:Family of unknown function (DUF6010)
MDLLPVSTAPPLLAMDYIGPAIGAVLFVLLMQWVPERKRRTFNAVFVGGASGVYLSGGFGIWELMYPALATPVVYRGLTSYRFIGIAWLMHAAWDLPHHRWGHPIWPFLPTSSFGCVVFDSLIAAWFLAGAPTWIARPARGATGLAESS